MAQPHDHLFQLAFADPVHAVLLLRSGLPAMKKFVSTRTQIRNEGKAEGRVEGQAQGRVELLLRQVAHRFGADAARDAEPRLRAASADQLDLIGERLLDAGSYDDLFAG